MLSSERGTPIPSTPKYSFPCPSSSRIFHRPFEGFGADRVASGKNLCGCSQLINCIPDVFCLPASTSYSNTDSHHGFVFVSGQEHGGFPSRLFKQLPDVMHLPSQCGLGVLRVPQAFAAKRRITSALPENPFGSSSDVVRATSRSPSRQCSCLK